METPEDAGTVSNPPIGGLVETTVGQLVAEGRLPSGYSYTMVEDTVDNVLRVEEVNQTLPWRKKAAQAAVVLATVDKKEVASLKADQAEAFVNGMLDADVVFSGMAWNAHVNGFTIKLGESLPCPVCAHPFSSISFESVRVWARQEPVSGPSAVTKITVDPAGLPVSLKDGDLYVTDPTWRVARMHVAERSWSNPNVVSVYRALAAIRFAPSGKGGPPRVVPEGKQIPGATLKSITEEMDKYIPHFHPTVDIECAGCKNTIAIPFELGL